MAVTLSMFTLKTRASFDTQHRLPYTPHRTRPQSPKNLNSLSPATTSQPQLTFASSSTSTSPTDSSAPLILSRNNKLPGQVKLDGTYMGYETWFPNPPKAEKPRSVHNAASLAYIGDCIYELYARRHFLFPPLSIEEYNDRVMAVVRCEAQDAMLQKLTKDNFLSRKERDILRWGRNVVSAKTRTKKRAGVAVYNRASSLETLIGHLYLTNKERLEEVMLKLGFSVGDSTQLIHEESKLTRKDQKSIEEYISQIPSDQRGGRIQLALTT